MGDSNKLFIRAIETGKTPEQLIAEALHNARTLTEAAERLGMTKQGLSHQLKQRGITNPFAREGVYTGAGK